MATDPTPYHYITPVLNLSDISGSNELSFIGLNFEVKLFDIYIFCEMCYFPPMTLRPFIWRQYLKYFYLSVSKLKPGNV